MYLGPVVVAQQVLDPSPQTSCPRKEKRGGGGVFETQQDSDSSAEDIVDTQDTQAEGKGQVKDQGRATCIRREDCEKQQETCCSEEEQKLMDFLRDNEILYNKHLMGYKDSSKREAVLDKFCEEKYMDKDACQRWFQCKRTLMGKVTHMKLGLGEPQLTEKQKWTRDNF